MPPRLSHQKLWSAIDELARRSEKRVELQSLNPAFERRVLKPEEILWMARIIWASQ